MIDIVKATDIKGKSSVYFIYGAPGVGKTSTIKFLPGKTLIIDVDKTSHVLKGEKNIDILSIDTSNVWSNWYKTLEDVTKLNYDNIVIDNITELERSFLSELGLQGGNGGIPTLKNYQQVQFEIIRSIRLLKNHNKNIVVTAWETSESFTDADTGAEYSVVVPDIQRKIRNNFMGLCDVVARLIARVKENKLERLFYLSPTRSVYAKNQIDDRTWCKQDELFIKAIPDKVN